MGACHAVSLQRSCRMDREFSTEPFKTPGKAAPPGKMTYEEFLAWAGEDTWAEWVDGEVIVWSPASLLHQLLVGFLYRLIGKFCDVHGSGIVLTAPFQMKLAFRPSGREPDLLYVAR